MVDSVGIKYSNYYRPHFKGEVEKVNNTERSFENDKDATEKYLTSKNIMLGLSAIGLVTLGIIGHKNGWFSKGAKTLAKNSSDDAQVNPQNLRVIVEAQLDGTKFILETDSKTGKMVKRTAYQNDSNTIKCIEEFDPQTGNPVKITYYKNEQVKGIIESDPQTEKMIKSTNFSELDGKIIKSVTEYDSKTGKEIKLTTYEPDGVTIKSIITYD